MSLIKANPVFDLLSMERDFNRLFHEIGKNLSFFGPNERVAENEVADWVPALDFFEDKDNYKVQMDLPGLKKEEVKISYLSGQLKISGERVNQQEKTEGKHHTTERSYGKFYRAFNLPKFIKENEIQAEFKDGQLTVVIPKAEEAKPKELEIKVK